MLVLLVLLEPKVTSAQLALKVIQVLLVHPA